MGTTEHTTQRTAPRRRAWRPVLAAVLSTGLMLSGWQAASAGTPTNGGSAAPLPATFSGDGAARAHDGDPASYAKGSASHWIRADLGATRRLDRVELSLPGEAQRVKLQGSANGRDFVDLSDTQARKGKVTLRLDGAPVRYVQVVGAHRVGELALYGAASGDSTPLTGAPRRPPERCDAELGACRRSLRVRHLRRRPAARRAARDGDALAGHHGARRCRAEDRLQRAGPGRGGQPVPGQPYGHPYRRRGQGLLARRVHSPSRKAPAHAAARQGRSRRHHAVHHGRGGIGRRRRGRPGGRPQP
ncbi:discoidin domain-containing protein [Streptomyces rimosus]|uniref:discoidin domain-containing protein n=1 Tax=Streptomyces rimosus TaxID=1927 RepID=UPI0030CA3266